MLRRGHAAVKQGIAGGHVQVTVRQDLAFSAVQAAAAQGQIAVSRMDNVAILIIDDRGLYRQIFAVTGEATATVIEVALMAKLQRIAARLSDRALLVRQIVCVNAQFVGRQAAAVVIQHFSAAGGQLALRGNLRTTAGEQVALPGVQRDVVRTAGTVAYIHALPTGGEIAGGQILPLSAQLA